MVCYIGNQKIGSTQHNNITVKQQQYLANQMVTMTINNSITSVSIMQINILLCF